MLKCFLLDVDDLLRLHTVHEPRPQNGDLRSDARITHNMVVADEHLPPERGALSHLFGACAELQEPL